MKNDFCPPPEEIANFTTEKIRLKLDTIDSKQNRLEFLQFLIDRYDLIIPYFEEFFYKEDFSEGYVKSDYKNPSTYYPELHYVLRSEKYENYSKWQREDFLETFNNTLSEFVNCKIFCVKRINQIYEIPDISNNQLISKDLSDPSLLGKIIIKSSMMDVVRIFEAMKKANIIEPLTAVKKIVNLNFSDKLSKLTVAKYGANKHKIKNETPKCSYPNLVNCIIELTKNLKDRDLETLKNYLEKK